MVQEPDRPADVEPKQATDQLAGNGAQAQAVEGQNIEALQQELESIKGKYLRALADGQNFQKRAVAERTEAVQRGQADMARSLLSVLDNFERTLEAARSSKDATAFAKGVQMIYEQMLKILGDFGLKEMELSKGDPFDPVGQQAIAQQPTEEVEPGHILHVAQAGYMMRDRILRPAAVVVAQSPEQEDKGRLEQ